ncbi:hypothetical protein MAR_023953 [Mya arenaria]|uniref:Uncharacterized protein n=1 Tax=Mya arenaria TaxID=6604 RepID=A0ABY7DTA4_MYAAR|nr:hypothetical protein MAR_023953 [Mya arenaria]
MRKYLTRHTLRLVLSLNNDTLENKIEQLAEELKAMKGQFQGHDERNSRCPCNDRIVLLETYPAAYKTRGEKDPTELDILDVECGLENQNGFEVHHVKQTNSENSNIEKLMLELSQLKTVLKCLMEQNDTYKQEIKELKTHVEQEGLKKRTRTEMQERKIEQSERRQPFHISDGIFQKKLQDANLELLDLKQELEDTKTSQTARCPGQLSKVSRTVASHLENKLDVPCFRGLLRNINFILNANIGVCHFILNANKSVCHFILNADKGVCHFILNANKGVCHFILNANKGVRHFILKANKGVCHFNLNANNGVSYFSLNANKGVFHFNINANKRVFHFNINANKGVCHFILNANKCVCHFNLNANNGVSYFSLNAKEGVCDCHFSLNANKSVFHFKINANKGVCQFSFNANMGVCYFILNTIKGVCHFNLNASKGVCHSSLNAKKCVCHFSLNANKVECLKLNIRLCILYYMTPVVEGDCRRAKSTPVKTPVFALPR